jgi:polyhydroxyalkanoate synthesis regulator phasin
LEEGGVIKVRDPIERDFLVGLGALTLTREKAQSIVDGLVKKGEARRDEAKGLVDRLVTRGEEERAEAGQGRGGEHRGRDEPGYSRTSRP